jgi:predicted dithiol-disulfide oxidoreductase (DUF899 family)
MTPIEVASMLKITIPAVRELTRNRTRVRSQRPLLPFIKIHKKAIRFEKTAVEKWLQQLAQSQTAKTARAR